MEKGFFNEEQFEFRRLSSKTSESNLNEAKIDQQNVHHNDQRIKPPAPPAIAQNTPTPNVLPKSTSRNEIPKDLLRSNVIDSLVTQNEDLSARLSVTLKKMALLEERLQNQIISEQDSRQTIERLSDQILLLEEKNSRLDELKESEAESRETAEKLLEQVTILQEKNKALEDFRLQKSTSIDYLTEKLKFLEIQSSEYYKEYREQKNAFESLQTRFEQHALRWSKNKNNLIAIARKFQSKLFKSNESEVSLNLTNASLQKEILELTKKLSESNEYISKLNKQAKLDLAQCTESFEEKIIEQSAQITKLLTANDALSAKASQKQKALEENIQLQNKVIFYQRKHDDAHVNHQNEILKLQERILALKGQEERVRLENLELKESLEKNNAQLTKEQDDNHLQNEQLEALRTLWKDQQRSYEKLQSQNEALVKLNRDLSVQINALRRQNEKDQVEL